MYPTHFSSLPLSPNRTVSWIHLGDTHLTRAGEQNEIDLGKVIDEINAVYATKGIDFVFIPGDIADDGSVVAYEAFRRHLDRLRIPWFGIVGDHDVHEKSFENFKRYVAAELYSSFTVGPYVFLRLNAFSTPKPDSFVLDGEQREWLEAQLKECVRRHQKAVLFLHCYPSDLKEGGRELTDLLHRYPVLLVDMGHTHYNEVSNDGQVLYSATRSTGQIEEGPVGYSVATLDAGCVSWHFVPLGSPFLVNVTRPADERLSTKRTGCEANSGEIPVRAKVWADSAVSRVHAQLGKNVVALHSKDGMFWEGLVDATLAKESLYDLQVFAELATGRRLTTSVRVAMAAPAERTIHAVDQNNALGEWKERGLLGTQLGPNKNGKKW